MPPKRTRGKPVGPKDLCLYLAEPDEQTGVVSDKWIKLVRQVVIDKIFSENSDHVAICRTDSLSSVSFQEANWDALRKVEANFRKKKVGGGKISGVRALLDVMPIIEEQENQDSYEARKILFFGDLQGQKYKDADVEKLAKTLKKQNVNLSMVFPNEDEMSSSQRDNYGVLKNWMQREEYEEFVYICNETAAIKQIFNTLTKQPKRPAAWNIALEIGPDIQIQVSQYVCTRKNTQSELKKALVKDEQHIPANSAGPSSSQSQAVVRYRGGDEDNNEGGRSDDQAKKTAVVEFAKGAVRKTMEWKERDGTVVSDSDLGKGFMYGDKLISFNELENDEVYKSGEKCLRVLVFCPRENIFPAFQQGDGTSVIYAKKNDDASEMKLIALIRALYNTNRVAVVRKVYRKDSRVVLGILSPDIDRQCLVFSELCFLDDISVPHFPVLFKQDANSEDEGTLTRKEEVMDQFILSNGLNDFHPFEGPVDPAAANMRNNVASRILDPSGLTLPAPIADSIDLYFEGIVERNNILEDIQECFPLKMNKLQEERPAGDAIFRKRALEAPPQSEVEQVKEAAPEEPVKKPKLEVKEEVNYDDLLDQL